MSTQERFDELAVGGELFFLETRGKVPREATGIIPGAVTAEPGCMAQVFERMPRNASIVASATVPTRAAPECPSNALQALRFQGVRALLAPSTPVFVFPGLTYGLVPSEDGTALRAGVDVKLGTMFSPAELDAKSLALHRLVVQKIQREPALLSCVQETISTWQSRSDFASLPYLMQWQALIDQGIDKALSAAIEDSERGQVLRQSSPFTRILTEAERSEFLASWSSSAAVKNVIAAESTRGLIDGIGSGD